MNIEADVEESRSQGDDYWVERMYTNSAAFEVIYNRYLPKISRFIYRKVGNQFATEELTSLVFFHAVEGIMIRKYSARNKFAAWLFSIARTKIADHFRERKIVSISEIQEERATETIYDIRKDQAPLASKENITFVNGRLEKCFFELTDFEQDLLALRFSAELDFCTIASILHKNTAAVKMATYRALNKLRKSMEGLNGSV